MPIDYSRYSADWPQIRARILERAKSKCEQCGAVNYEPHPETGSRVVLTIAHLNHDVTDNRPENLRAWCQRCHLTYDAHYHARNAKRTRERKRREAAQEAGQLELFED